MQTWQIHTNRKCKIIFNPFYLYHFIIRIQSLNYDLFKDIRRHPVQNFCVQHDKLPCKCPSASAQSEERQCRILFIEPQGRARCTLLKPSATGERTIVNNDLTQAPATVTKLSSTVLTRLIIQHKLAKTDLAHSVCSTHAHTQQKQKCICHDRHNGVRRVDGQAPGKEQSYCLMLGAD